MTARRRREERRQARQPQLVPQQPVRQRLQAQTFTRRFAPSVTVSDVLRTLERVSQPVPQVRAQPVQRSGQVLSSRFGAAPQALVKRHSEWISNNPDTQGAIGLIRAVTKDVRMAAAVRDEIRNANPVGRGMTARNTDSLQRAGVLTQERSDASCLSEHRPTATKGDGTSRPFVPWCSKGEGKK